MLVDIDIARQHLREDSGDPEDLLRTYLGAAEQAAVDYLGRSVYATADDMAKGVLAGTAGRDPMLIDRAIVAAILLILGHLHANREDVVVGASAVELPQGAKDLLRPKRRTNGL